MEFHEKGDEFMQICFIGHRVIEKTKGLEALLEETVVTLIKKGATNFLFGSKSAFNDLAWEVVTRLKKEYPFIKRVYVRSTYQNIEKSYEEYLLQFYEETYFSKKLENAGKSSYVKRNFEMIDCSTYCVFYYDESYVASLKRNSGTKIAYAYALKRKKKIINVYTQ